MKYHYRHGDRPIDGYTILRGVGRGGFGEVYYAKSDAGREVALKTVLRNEDVELRSRNRRHSQLSDSSPPSPWERSSVDGFSRRSAALLNRSYVLSRGTSVQVELTCFISASISAMMALEVGTLHPILLHENPAANAPEHLCRVSCARMRSS